MASIDRTAYPRFRGPLTDADLEAAFNLSEDDEAFVRRHARGEGGRLSMALSLKTRQFLGYFPALDKVPDQIRRHIATSSDSMTRRCWSMVLLGRRRCTGTVRRFVSTLAAAPSPTAAATS
jgi:hypothetical protein